MEKYLHQLWDTALTFLAGITPAALGAAVSLFYEKGLTWGDRFARLAVGVTVSWFASGLFAAACKWWFKIEPDPFVLQGTGFVFGMIAYKATPGFISSSSDAVARIPAGIGAWFGKKDPGQ